MQGGRAKRQGKALILQPNIGVPESIATATQHSTEEKRRPSPYTGWLPWWGLGFSTKDKHWGDGEKGQTFRQKDSPMDEREALIERVSVLTTEKDAEALRQMAQDLDELIAGVHKLAEQALKALKAGQWQNAIPDLERLRVIE